jgi:hypothetical protein
MTIDEILKEREAAGLHDPREMAQVMAQAQADADVLLDDLCSKAGVTYRWYPAQNSVSIPDEVQK